MTGRKGSIRSFLNRYKTQLGTTVPAIANTYYATPRTKRGLDNEWDSVILSSGSVEDAAKRNKKGVAASSKRRSTHDQDHDKPAVVNEDERDERDVERETAPVLKSRHEDAEYEHEHEQYGERCEEVVRVFTPPLPDQDFSS